MCLRCGILTATTLLIIELPHLALMLQLLQMVMYVGAHQCIVLPLHVPVRNVSRCTTNAVITRLMFTALVDVASLASTVVLGTRP